VKLWKKGVMDQEILAILMSNMRIADQRIGDIKAQGAALTTGEQRLTALIDRYGASVVKQAIAEMRHRAERQMRARIAAIPDGVYEGTSTVDSDGVVDAPLTIRMKITKRAEDLTFDLTGSSPPCRGPMNSVIATTKSAIYLAIKHVFPEVPINAGTFGPNELDDTFGPEVRFIKAPPAGQANLAPSAGYQFFGHVHIDGRSEVMTVTLKDRANAALWSIGLEPRLG